jgi:hypothetical protein
MTSVTSTFGRTSLARLAAVIAALMLALLTSIAVAQGAEFSGHLPAKSWTTNGAYTWMNYIVGTNHSAGSICVTPAEYSGGWTFPYGWACRAGEVQDVADVYGYPAVDNPNSSEISFTLGYW